MKRLILLSLLLLVILFCSDEPEDQINTLEKPVVILAISKESVILKGNDGRIVEISGVYRIVNTLVESGYQPGDTLIAE